MSALLPVCVAIYGEHQRVRVQVIVRGQLGLDVWWQKLGAEPTLGGSPAVVDSIHRRETKTQSMVGLHGETEPGKIPSTGAGSARRVGSSGSEGA